MRRCISGRCFSPSENREGGEVTTGNMSVLRRLYLALSSFASLLHTLISPDSFVCVCVFFNISMLWPKIAHCCRIVVSLASDQPHNIIVIYFP